MIHIDYEIEKLTGGKLPNPMPECTYCDREAVGAYNGFTYCYGHEGQAKQDAQQEDENISSIRSHEE